MDGACQLLHIVSHEKATGMCLQVCCSLHTEHSCWVSVQVLYVRLLPDSLPIPYADFVLTPGLLSRMTQMARRASAATRRRTAKRRRRRIKRSTRRTRILRGPEPRYACANIHHQGACALSLLICLTHTELKSSCDSNGSCYWRQ